MTEKPTLKPVDVEKLCKAVTTKFGLGKCLECSKALASELRKAGISGERVQLKAQGCTRGFIVMKNTKASVPFSIGSDEAISRTGLHFGVKVMGRIYCNVFRSGISAQEWGKQFDCDTHELRQSVVERL